MTSELSMIAASFALIAAGCNGDDSAFGTDSGSLTEGSAQEYGVLAFLNGPDATLALLDYDIGLDRRAATSIAGFVRGPDGEYATEDDSRLATITQLDGLYWVGERAIEQILAYVESIGGIPEVRVEGVYFTDAEAAATIALCNGAPLATLDDGARLDARAARGITEQRPFGTVMQIGQVSYVGPAALRSLRDFEGTWEQPDGVDRAARIAAILASHGVLGLRADFPDDIVDDQAALFGDHVSFEDALDAAVHSYLTDGADGESPLEVVRNIGPWMDCPQADTLDRLVCNLNLGSAVIGVVRHEGDPEEQDMWLPEGGERPDENVWVFYLLIPSTGDHTHWAVVSRERDANGDIAVYNYGFN